MIAAPVVGIAGVGLIGASIGLRAAQYGWDTLGWDLDPEHARQACEVGALRARVASFDELIRLADILVLAAPLDATVTLLEHLAAAPPARATLILDVASVKLPVEKAGASLATFVATHPIAGSERSGPLAASADLFERRTWTHAANGSPEAIARVRAFIAAMGAEPYALDSAEHDRIVAMTSHLPQLLSVALGARLAPELDDPAVRALCGTGVRSMLRLGASSWPIWRAIVAANRVAIAQEVRGLAVVLSAVADGLEYDGSQSLAADFAASSETVARLAANTSEPVDVMRSTLPPDERLSWTDGSASA